MTNWATAGPSSTGRLLCRRPLAIIPVLEDAVTGMQARAAVLAGRDNATTSPAPRSVLHRLGPMRSRSSPPATRQALRERVKAGQGRACHDNHPGPDGRLLGGRRTPGPVQRSHVHPQPFRPGSRCGCDSARDIHPLTSLVRLAGRAGQGLTARRASSRCSHGPTARCGLGQPSLTNFKVRPVRWRSAPARGTCIRASWPAGTRCTGNGCGRCWRGR